ncbi:hypothetical protein BJ980_002698 [Nocardioides daedukensis]|uniref:Uncharacterized protein n=1 Tax=Nocardioides daedukensis TaxID=634462 RepID=A0A7Y9UVZ5_9ACTN|nr:hypothetical protein [Nocardioides daedukensis]NYG59775.1 hypothetical protein [Nocardioides daedukensis]
MRSLRATVPSGTPRLLAAGAVAAALLLTVGGCSQPSSDSSEQPAQQNGAAAAPAAPAAAQANTVATPATGLSKLQFVAQSAAPCTQVWIGGAQLPANYEWCSDQDGEPVAGVREGSCEVIVHGTTMWAIPGRQIHVTGTDVSLDPGYTDATRSCKRRAVAANQR